MNYFRIKRVKWLLSVLAALLGVSFFFFRGSESVSAQTRLVTGGITTSTAVATPDAAFCNASPITITDNAAANPFPSVISVSGLSGVVSKVTVNINGLTHAFSADTIFLLVGPTGKKMILLGQVGGLDAGTPSVTGANLTFDDAAPTHIPVDTGIVSGTFQPTNYIGAEGATPNLFSAPAATPASPYFATLSTFNSTNPNGDWSLYVVDNFTGDAGSITGGWCLNITTAPAVAGAPFTIFQGSIANTDAVQVGRLSRNGLTTSQSEAPTACPGAIQPGVSLFYDKYTITNTNLVPTQITVTTTSGCGSSIFSSAYSPSYTAPADLCTNYIADAGHSPPVGVSATAFGPAFSLTMNAGQTVDLVVNQVTSGTLCSAYSLLVEGQLQPPTAGGVTISGRVLTSNGRGIQNATVKLSGQNGQTKTVTTGRFGAYTFDDVEAGSTYVLTVISRQFAFENSSQVISLTDSISDINFVANPGNID